MVEKQQATGGSMVGFALIILILFLLFPVFTWYLVWFAIIVMLLGGIITMMTGGAE
jgi:hypothetical protein|nr:hypothetical protein [uncultured Methanobacterium sp.]